MKEDILHYLRIDYTKILFIVVKEFLEITR